MDLRPVVRHYISNFRPYARAELESFAQELSLAEAVRRAARAESRDPGRRRFSHQHRLQQDDIDRAEQLLSEQLDEIASKKSFARLFEVVKGCLRVHHGVGELYLYDTALRIGAKCGLLPQRVYLHRGTRQGADALGLDTSTGVIDKWELPDAFREVEMHEVEDILCIYKRYFDGSVPDIDDSGVCWLDDDEDEQLLRSDHCEAVQSRGRRTAKAKGPGIAPEALAFP